MPRRCAFGCPPSGTRMHCFPDPNKHPDKFRTWVYLVGGNLETALDIEFYAKKRICDLHFTEEDKNRYNRLNALAVPSLHLHGQDSAASVSHESLMNVGQPSLSLDTDRSMGQAITASTSLINIGQPSLPLETGISVSHGITSSEPGINVDQRFSANTGEVNLDTAVAATSVLKEHNYSAISRPHLQNPRRKPVSKYVLSPLYTKLKYLRTEISRLRKKSKSFQARLSHAEKFSKDMVFNQVLKKLKKPAQLFLKMQLQSVKKSKGRRFTLEQKVLSLSLYKRSPRGYGLLNKYFTLPSVKAMKRLLSKIKLTPGINQIIFKELKKSIVSKDKSDRLCSLIFDEMSIMPQIFYNTQKDCLEGFTTTDGNKFADHALVFMVKGLKLNFKQPIAYYFTNSLQKIDLKNLIIDVIKHAQDAGLIIINTVCDQSSVNVSAVTDLVNDTKRNYLRREKECRHDFFRVNGQNIIPIFDAPHLIKGIRNNLLSKDMRYTINGEEKLVKWEYFEMVYRADKSYGELRLLDKITEEHIDKQKMNKMKVKLATQLFSHSLAVVAEHLTARGDLPEECRQIIPFVLMMNNLFDSLNIDTLHIPNGKKFKGPVKQFSPHHQLWQDAKAMLKTVKFIEKRKVGDKVILKEKIVPSITNFIKTIEGVEAIWKVVSQKKYGYDALLTRNLNQDPAENFFGNIRSYGARNVAPNTVAFEGAFKALLLNNYNSPHSSGANCEEDQNKCLQTLDFLITEEQKDPDVSQNTSIPFDTDFFNVENIESGDAGQRNYVCGWVLTKCLKQIVKSCQQCRQTLLDSDNNNLNNKYTRAKEYCNKKWLTYPSPQLENCFHELQNLTLKIMKKDTPKAQIKQTILSFAEMVIEFPFDCPIHKENLKTFFVSTTINILLHSWCRSINRILSGKIVYEGDDKTKNAAQQYFNKHQHNKNKK